MQDVIYRDFKMGYGELPDQRGPSILIFSDSLLGAQDAQSAAEAIGGRIVASLPFDAASERMKTQIAVDVVMIEYTGIEGQSIDALLDQIGTLAARPATLLTTTLEYLDQFAWRLTDDRMTMLCGACMTDRVTALQLAMLGAPRVLHDVTAEPESVRLRRLADEVGRIARALSNLSATAPVTSAYKAGVSDMMMGFRAEPAHDPVESDMPRAADLRAAIRLRRMRDQFFESDLFADPAWDMLLDLMAARIDQVQVAVSSLCIAAAVPPTTALRWIKRMTDEGLFERVADPDDGRRIFIRLSDSAAHGVARYWAAAHRSGGNAI